MKSVSAIAVWLLLLVLILVPFGFALTSPLLEWRQPIYIIAGIAGVIALTFMLLQPLLAARILPFIGRSRGVFLHRITGASIVILVLIHVVGLWVTSPPDVIDALLFVSATPFSVWGVIAMWALFASATLVLLKRRMRHHRRVWSLSHRVLAVVIVSGTVTHTLMIEGTMEIFSKSVLCLAVLLATLFIVLKPKLLN